MRRPGFQIFPLIRFKVHRTVSIGFKPGAFCEAVWSMGLAAKNLRNMGVLLVKNVLSSFAPEGKLRPLGNLHANQTQALAAANAAAQACDATRPPRNHAKAKALAALEARLAPEAPKIKARTLFADLMGPEANPWAVLDDRLLDKLMRTRKDAGGACPFEALPAKASEQVRMQVSSEFKGWLAAPNSYRGHPAKSARPKRRAGGSLHKEPRLHPSNNSDSRRRPGRTWLAEALDPLGCPSRPTPTERPTS